MKDCSITILHRCRSHIMKNAKSLCKKHIPKHYRFGMHVIGLLTSANSMVELEEMVTSATVVISSPCVGENVEKHFQNIKTMLAFLGDLYLVESKVSAEDQAQGSCRTPGAAASFD
ncbi:hypothetical protein MHYP_G00072040 [Metynnis hypsauchen]